MFRACALRLLYQLEAAALLYELEGPNAYVSMPERAAKLLGWLRQRYYLTH